MKNSSILYETLPTTEIIDRSIILNINQCVHQCAASLDIVICIRPVYIVNSCDSSRKKSWEVATTTKQNEQRNLKVIKKMHLKCSHVSGYIKF